MDIDEVMITNKDELDGRHISIHAPYEYYKYEIVKKSEGNQCCAALYEILPGKSNYPYHYHAKSEEIFYIISGIGIVETPSGLRTVKAGDIIVCPPTENGAHRLFNASETELLTYLDFDTVSFPEMCFYPHTKKVGVFANSKQNGFFKEDTKVGYYEGEQETT